MFALFIFCHTGGARIDSCIPGCTDESLHQGKHGPQHHRGTPVDGLFDHPMLDSQRRFYMEDVCEESGSRN